MKLFKISCIAAAAALSILTTSCSDPSFSVKGSVEGGVGKTILLEKSDQSGFWVALDSANLKKSGVFSFKQFAPAAPEIYRLSLDGSYIYFPVDSIENIRIQANAQNFATDYSISGSANAEALAKFEKELIAYSPKLVIEDSARNFKRRIFTEYLQDAKGSVVSYYILTKTVGNKPLFDAPEDVKYFAAVATSFRQFRPEDPRTLLLEQTATDARRRQNIASGKRTVLQAEEVGFFPISLPDENGSNVNLSDLAGHGVPTVLLFSALTDDKTPALNIELKKLYDAGGIRIYNVGFDTDGLAWRTSARNLPWTTVYANLTDARKVAGDYQVADLPTFFVIDAQGNLKARCSSIEELRKAL